MASSERSAADVVASAVRAQVSGTTDRRCQLILRKYFGTTTPQAASPLLFAARVQSGGVTLKRPLAAPLPSRTGSEAGRLRPRATPAHLSPLREGRSVSLVDPGHLLDRESETVGNGADIVDLVQG